MPTPKLNRIKCAKCGTVVTSRSCSDFAECQCGAVGVQGGTLYKLYYGDLSSVLVYENRQWVPFKPEKNGSDVAMPDALDTMLREVDKYVLETNAKSGGIIQKIRKLLRLN